jgi:shikimate kinase
LPSEPAKIVFIGLMAVGKTTVGRLVAERLGRPLSDSDLAIEREQGRSAKEIAAAEGGDALHDLEAKHLLDALAAPGPLVICAAASIVERADCRDALRPADVFVAWLTAPTAALAERFGGDPHRPVYDADTVAMLDRQLADRAEKLKEVADEIVPTAGRSPEEIAEGLLPVLGGSRLGH